MGHKNPDCVSGKLSVIKGNPLRHSKKLMAMNFYKRQFCMSWLFWVLLLTGPLSRVQVGEYDKRDSNGDKRPGTWMSLCLRNCRVL